MGRVCHERVDSKVSIEVTLLPRMTYEIHEILHNNLSICTHHCANGMLMRRSAFLHRVVDDKIQEKIITAQDTADFAPTLEMDEKLLIHKLGEIGN